jgi:two-component system, sensor histidine kinase and response regulator
MGALFDREALLERVDGDVEFLAETVDLLDADAPGLLEQLRAAVASGDANAVRRSAHTLKGMVANFCAPPAQEAALRLEQQGRSGDLVGAEAATADLATQVERLRGALRAYLEEIR